MSKSLTQYGGVTGIAVCNANNFDAESLPNLGDNNEVSVTHWSVLCHFHCMRRLVMDGTNFVFLFAISFRWSSAGKFPIIELSTLPSISANWCAQICCCRILLHGTVWRSEVFCLLQYPKKFVFKNRPFSSQYA